MNQEKLTNKAMEALGEAQSLAQSMEHQNIEPLHLLSALLKQDGGVVPALLSGVKAGCEKALAAEIESRLAAKPKVKGEGGKYVSRELSQVFIDAEKLSKEMQDEFVSCEHMFLSMFSGDTGELLQKCGVTADAAKKALASVRGASRVTDRDPEGKYNALEKYGQDLTALAAAGKLDPVIDRDEEI
ncbi:MAG: type VI secretion system ATPase TssH, partial [Abditibacteriota bacterium]|nr:type VI secretion system ATPase TssH [Abditibacteriota bacterium]